MGFVEAKNTFDESDGVYFITGLIGFRPPLICKKIIPGYVYVMVLHAIYCFCFISTIFYFNDMYVTMEIYSKSSKSRIIQAYLNPIFVTIMIMSGLANASKVLDTGIELSIIDEKLKLVYGNIDFTNLTRMDFGRIFEIIIYTIMFNLLEYFPQVTPDTSSYFIFVWIVNSYPQFLNSIVIASFGIFMAKIRRRFEAINRMIPKMKFFEKNSASSLENEMNNVFTLRLINKVHEKLVNAAADLNEAYGFVLLLSFAFYCLICCFYLGTISKIYTDTIDMIDLMVNGLWLIFYLGKCIYVIDACHSVTLQGKLAGRLLREKWTDVDHHPLKQEADLLIRQIESRNLQLTAYNFFVMDYAALKMIIVALAAYLIVVSQPTASCDENPN